MAETRRMRALLVAAMCVMAAGCWGGRESVPRPAPAVPDPAALEPDGGQVIGGKIRVAVNAESNGWDPITDPFSQATTIVVGSVSETLGLMNRDGDFEPWLATEFRPSSDFRSWDVTLRAGVTYHDGEPLDASNLKANLDDRVAHSAVKRADVEGNIDHVEVVSPLVARVVLREPHAQLDIALAATYMVPTSRLTADRTLQQVSPIGTGPFVFSEWVRDQRFVAKRNPNYWRSDSAGRRLPYLDSIEYRPIVDDDVRAKALRAGDVDMAMATATTSVEQLAGDFDVIKDWGSERTFVILNTTEGDGNTPNPFTNVHARRALAAATDRNAIAALVGTGVSSTPQPYRPGSKWALPEGDEGYSAYDPDRARAEVDSYMRETGAGSLTFRLSMSGGVGEQQIGQALQQQWSEAGINAAIDVKDQAGAMVGVLVGRYTASTWRWFGMPNPVSNMMLVDARQLTPIGQLSLNQTRFTSPTMAAHVGDLQTALTLEGRQATAKSIWREANEQALNVWLYDTPTSVIASHKVRGLNLFRTHVFASTGAKPGWPGEWWVQP